jgi:hypothetical protein
MTTAVVLAVMMTLGNFAAVLAQQANGLDDSMAGDQTSVVPAGAVMPSNPLTAGAPLPTANPYAPPRPTPTLAGPSASKGSLRTANFVINNFYIAIAAVMGFAGLVVAVIIARRWWTGGTLDRSAINARFDKEQVGLGGVRVCVRVCCCSRCWACFGRMIRSVSLSPPTHHHRPPPPTARTPGPDGHAQAQHVPALPAPALQPHALCGGWWGGRWWCWRCRWGWCRHLC